MSESELQDHVESNHELLVFRSVVVGQGVAAVEIPSQLGADEQVLGGRVVGADRQREEVAGQVGADASGVGVLESLDRNSNGWPG
jgi:hypothetical protein